jgi:hypothetical protein
MKGRLQNKTGRREIEFRYQAENLNRADAEEAPPGPAEKIALSPDHCKGERPVGGLRVSLVRWVRACPSPTILERARATPHGTGTGQPRARRREPRRTPEGLIRFGTSSPWTAPPRRRPPAGSRGYAPSTRHPRHRRRRRSTKNHQSRRGASADGASRSSPMTTLD